MMFQVCLSATIAVAKQTRQNVVYFDTGSAFDISRVRGMLENQNADETVSEIHHKVSKII